jgi:hypothetical protein
MLKKVVGIISYIPDREPDRSQRIDRLERLLNQITQFWPSLPIMVISQNWKDYSPKQIIINFSYDKLGIIKARKTLRERFLESEYDYLIMFDDDAIIQCLDGNSPQDYLDLIDKHPDGFMFLQYDDGSQLNGCAISKQIYSVEPMVNVDAEKSEAFEDDLFSWLLHNKYPEKEFTCNFIKCTHFKNPNETAPSTWAKEGKKDWKKLRQKTIDIKKYISEHKELPPELLPPKEKILETNKIDIVVPYVDSSDENWQRLYLQYTPKTVKEDSNGKQRFRKNDLFKYWFRSVEKYVPWVNNVFLLVQSISQVPNWLLNTDKVKIITHEQFIPLEYLPVFNSQAIEMFLHKIPGLSERFLYSNDDMYFTGPLNPEDYFTSKGVKIDFKLAYIGLTAPMPLWKIAILNSGFLVNKEETESLKELGTYITPMHVTRPYLKSKIEEVHNVYGEEILKSITKFREEHNFTVYVYDFYMRKNKLIALKSYNHSHFSNKTSIHMIANFMANSNVNKVMCLNDTLETVDRDWENKIMQKFNDKYPNKSKYEV